MMEKCHFQQIDLKIFEDKLRQIEIHIYGNKFDILISYNIEKK